MIFKSAADRCARLLDRPCFAAGVIFILLFGVFGGRLGADPDLFARVAAGRLLFETGAIPLQDPFAFTPKKPVWIDHEWLSGAVFHLLSQAGGDLALFLFKCLCAFVTIAVLMRAGRQAGFWPLLVCALGCAYVWNSTVRAQVFTFLFLGIYLWVLARWRRERGEAALLWLPALMVLWVNLHGGFVAGLGLLALFAAGRCLQERRVDAWLAGALPACVAATAANPYGPLVYWSYILEALWMPRPAIGEWGPIRIVSFKGILMLLWTALLAAGLYQKRRNLEWAVLLPAAVSLLAACLHQRFLAVYLMISFVFGGEFLEAGWQVLMGSLRLPQGMLRRIGSAGAVSAAALALTIGLIHFRPAGFRLSYSDYPVDALAWLASSRSGGKLLVDFNAGSFALWRLYPRFLVSMDGRYEEVYPEETLGLVNAALSPDDPAHVGALAQVAPDFILLGRNMRAFGRPGSFGADWHLLYHDGTYLLLGREPNPLGITGTRAGEDSAPVATP